MVLPFPGFAKLICKLCGIPKLHQEAIGERQGAEIFAAQRDKECGATCAADSAAHIVEAQLEALRILIAKMSVSPGRIPALG